ncbi:DNA N-glycosylase [Aspergillus sclerotioniger CBS 115572]|uniref:DNA-(apurinic or apyrimidinic site) lyase n=1 Tax=Aspergillus sclerotioniger CBS 115572 TaxID=1450535 RepID=A0A317XCH2_9EURO|nr:DNA N-glycosylase [Aspergillus sclerotioniger CBS 115572]PWY96324.1 DNA N-glycosylase [Aspergillus sclerotioniger CBS 115572]
MTVGAFSEWRKLPLSLNELCINTTLRCGQSFRWHNVPDTDEWRCVLHGRLLSLKQDQTHLHYRTYRSSKPPNHLNEDDTTTTTTLSLLTHYFNLTTNLTTLYTEWSAQDPNFRKKASQFTGIRILRQDAWEALVSFICSSNNNIARISQMVEKLCLNHGPFIASVDGRAYHGFPPPEALTAQDVEGKLRGLGFGYRAKYIYQTAVMVAKEREKGWLDSLQNPECPAWGVEVVPGGEMRPEGREGYREAHGKLLELQGVGPKVADCVCLMGLGWGEAVPVDTHVWQIAQRDYKFGKGSNKSLTKVTYDAVGNHFRKLWGKEAGWAHSVLFTADLRTFSDRLAATTKKVEVKTEVKEEKDGVEDIEVETKVTTAMAVPTKRSLDDAGVKVEDDEETKEDGKPNTLVQASQTTTRRMSKRLRNR